ncbi:hypothetical protein GIY11_09520 [Aerococcaceae bacterium DSM 109653]|uniref:HTH cro/C1-type domain-containing protein n=1 Tax=Fundicoccus ignavus TaxID=2664442 RepID=A0A844BJS9_9LACT|nr:helix-turn-helix transcriptional regulator [Fundicoccus ignavus]MRI82245.1 hypothetical protein [Fundicoccus ignavus]
MENLGQALDWVRRNRNMTIETLCEGVMSPSSYSRLVNGKTFVSSKSFMTLIFRLNMTFAMFLQDYHNFFQNRHDYALLIHAQAYEDTEMLSALLETYYHQKQEQNKDWNNFDERLLKVTAALLDQLQESPDAATSLEAVKLELATLSHFTDNDFTAFHLLLPYLALTEADEILQVPLGKVTNLQEPALPEGLYHVCGDLFTRHLIADNIEQAEFYYQKLTEIYIDPTDFNWKISRKIHQSIWQYFTSDQDLACQKLQRLIELYGELELSHLQEKTRQTCVALGVPIGEVIR